MIFWQRQSCSKTSQVGTNLEPGKHLANEPALQCLTTQQTQQIQQYLLRIHLQWSPMRLPMPTPGNLESWCLVQSIRTAVAFTDVSCSCRYVTQRILARTAVNIPESLTMRRREEEVWACFNMFYLPNRSEQYGSRFSCAHLPGPLACQCSEPRKQQLQIEQLSKQLLLYIFPTLC